ncbi:MAG: excisionase [Clostridium sp.]|nr:excisionase [Clostridium sp.]
MENPTFQKAIPQITGSKEIPLWQKYTLTVEEASRYFRIGQAKLRRIISENEDADFILWNGNRPQVKRKLFEEFVDKLNVI